LLTQGNALTEGVQQLLVTNNALTGDTNTGIAGLNTSLQNINSNITSLRMQVDAVSGKLDTLTEQSAAANVFLQAIANVMVKLTFDGANLQVRLRPNAGTLTDPLIVVGP